MPKSDWEFYNCSQKHEEDYVANQYVDTEGVRKFLQDKCDSKEIYNSTHKEVYAMLKDANFKKKK